MNTEEVVAMIDAITEGKDYVLRPKVIEGYQGIAIGVSDDSVLFSTEGDPLGTRIEDPRTAREIAGALVAWANRKEGNTNTVASRAIIGQLRWAETNSEAVVDENGNKVKQELHLNMTTEECERFVRENCTIPNCQCKSSGEADGV